MLTTFTNIYLNIVLDFVQLLFTLFCVQSLINFQQYMMPKHMSIIASAYIYIFHSLWYLSVPELALLVWYHLLQTKRPQQTNYLVFQQTLEPMK